MTGLEEVSELRHFEQLLQDRAKQLLSFLDRGDFSAAMQILAELSEARSSMLYQEVGRLTRGLHEAIKEFNIDVENSSAFRASAGEEHLSEVASANERLNYVLQLTEQAANTTMDMVDNGMPVVADIGEQARLLRQDWQQMAASPDSTAGLRELGQTSEQVLGDIEKAAGSLNKNFTEILLAQGFQDITGQLIKRVIGLVNDVESNLLKLVAVAGQVDSIRGSIPDAEVHACTDSRGADIPSAAPSTADMPAGDQLPATARATADAEKEQQLVKGHGPQMHPQKASDVVAGQDEVDDLLSSLGF